MNENNTKVTGNTRHFLGIYGTIIALVQPVILWALLVFLYVLIAINAWHLLSAVMASGSAWRVALGHFSKSLFLAIIMKFAAKHSFTFFVGAKQQRIKSAASYVDYTGKRSICVMLIIATFSGIVYLTVNLCQILNRLIVNPAGILPKTIICVGVFVLMSVFSHVTCEMSIRYAYWPSNPWEDFLENFHSMLMERLFGGD